MALAAELATGDGGRSRPDEEDEEKRTRNREQGKAKGQRRWLDGNLSHVKAQVIIAALALEGKRQRPR
jgi:hypothetical protein